MYWTMPHRALQIVAFLLILVSATAFAMGAANTLQRGGRLPGQKIPGSAGVGPTIEAVDATPLADERIEGPPPPNPDDEAKAQAAKEKDAETDDDTPSAPAANTAAPVLITPPPAANTTESEANAPPY